MKSKSRSKVRKTSKGGRVVLPREMRRMLEIEIHDPVKISLGDDRIIIKKYTPHMACSVTGEVTTQNIKVGKGTIALSPQGAEMLMNELKGVLV